MQKILVTGASGFVGSHLVAELVSRGHAPVLTSRKRPRYLDLPQFKHLQHIQADINDSEAIATALSGIDTVFHIGALFSFFAEYEELYKVNAQGTDTLCRLARKAGVKRFVHFSSGAIYGTHYGNKLVSETDAPDPTDDYARSKWEAEKLLITHLQDEDGFSAISLRFGAIYGPGSNYGDATALFLLKKGLLFVRPGLSDVLSSHIHVEDAAGAALHLAEREESFGSQEATAGDIAFNLCDDAPTYNSELLKTANRILPSTWEVPGLGLRLPRMPYTGIPVPAFVLKGFAFLAELFAKVTKTKPLFEVDSIDYITCGHGLKNDKLKATGYQFKHPSIVGALEDTIRWYEATDWQVFRDGDPSVALTPTTAKQAESS